MCSTKPNCITKKKTNLLWKIAVMIYISCIHIQRHEGHGTFPPQDLYIHSSKYRHSCNTPGKSIKGMIFIKLLIKMNGITDMWYDILNWIMSYSDADYSQED